VRGVKQQLGDAVGVQAISAEVSAVDDRLSEDATELERLRKLLLGTIWSGHYSCMQGDTAVDLQFTDVDNVGVVHARFNFHNLAMHANARDGEYILFGKYYIPDKTFYMTPLKWVREAPDYEPVGFVASLHLQGLPPTISGTISATGCGKIYVRMNN
jgi:hypothetical protein